MRYAVIMAGGSGTRLWPLSTAQRPKQLIPIVGGKSLIRIANDRLEGLIPAEQRCIAASQSVCDRIAETLPEIPRANIIGEPAIRDTLPAMGLTAAVLHKTDPDAVIAVFTADHIIEPIELFQQRIDTAMNLAEANPDALITFGIEPTHPATAYGYVELGEESAGFDHTHTTNAFKEKPDRDTAEQYINSGKYLWNSGMFVWRASALLRAIEKYEPQVSQGLQQIADAWHTDQQQATLENIYPALNKTSIDFAVMEPAAADPQTPVFTVRMPVKWLDVGSYSALAETVSPDTNQNRIDAPAAFVSESTGNLIISDDPNHLIAVSGIENLVVVKTENATLICTKQHAEQLKQLHAALRENGFEKYL